MSPRGKKILKWVGYPFFYLFALVVFLYLTLPTDRAKAKIEAEFNARQTDENPLTLRIGDLDTYWLSGVEVEDVELVGQPKVKEDGKLGKAERFSITRATARASIWSAIVGDTSVSFDAEAFDGTIKGTYGNEDGTQHIHIEVADLGVDKLPFVQAAIGIPMQGSMTGSVDLTIPGGKLAEADGTVDLEVQGLRVGDGKTKIRDTIALPEIKAGTLSLKAEAAAGTVTVSELKCDGTDIKVDAAGKIKLRDPFDSSLAEMTLSFSFKDAYRNKNEMTAALLGKPGGPPGVLDLDPKVKRAKKPDGSYAWRLSGPVGKLRFDPASGGASLRGNSIRNRLKGGSVLQRK
ncbi:MAG: type II secretion system protein GspN [Polyangiaceae bacterium]|nr:type II secretion system protein GspN [Myxococcales bacterium]MCB9584278.1 type II secretion system protein GspN [Polyangiaceae bacterium]MCB9608559.1 type II secretion system protein GspN [Polyangiaceae bacterium]